MPSGKRVGEARKIASMASGHSKELNGGHRRSTERANNIPFCYADGHLSSQECGFGTKFQKYKVRIVLRGDTVKDDSGSYFLRRFCLLCSISLNRVRLQHNDGRTSIGCRSKATKMSKTSSQRSISLHPSQNGGRFNIIETSSFRMSRYLDTPTTTQVSQILVKLRRPNGSS